jgi:AcrR family transcriptional regulator
MSTRLTRAEQTERNRASLLAAARRVFLARGYHGASLDQIADEAGFSKGVVYSQFDDKADLFLTPLEARIEERAASNARAVEGLTGDRGIEILLEHAARFERVEPEWGLLVIEFRVHAARDRSLNRRYAAAHARTVAGMERVITRLYERTGEPPPLAPPQLAQLLVAFGAGARLEQAVDPDSLPATLFAALLARVIGTASELSPDGAGVNRAPASPAHDDTPEESGRIPTPPTGAGSHDHTHPRGEASHDHDYRQPS